MAGAGVTDQQNRVLSTLNADGSRRWLRPWVSAGRFLNARRAVGYFLILLFTVLPHLRINAKPPILLDIPAREFTFFGTTLYPTDTLLLTVMVVGVFLTVFFLTAVFGRVWCGWACPQTVYLELIYRPIERFFDGQPGRKPKQGAWRKPAKYIVYVLLSAFLAHTFLAYFVGTDRLLQWMTRSPLEHPISFLVMAFVTALMLFDFGFFREQLCIVACPYGRFQSVMLDRESLIISYDPERGEPRGKAKRDAKDGDVALNVIGDCVDCGMCVRTCPTGIDIREGLQMECVNCAQCIDACDRVMDRLKRPRGLIRYTSLSALEHKRPHVVRPRVAIYGVLITALIGVFVTLLVTRAPAFVTVTRTSLPGTMPFSTTNEGLTVVNQIRVKIHNRTPEERTYEVSLTGLDGAMFLGQPSENLVLTVGPFEIEEIKASAGAPREAFRRGPRDVGVLVTEGDDFSRERRFRLLGPAGGVTPPPETGETDA